MSAKDRMLATRSAPRCIAFPQIRTKASAFQVRLLCGFTLKDRPAGLAYRFRFRSAARVFVREVPAIFAASYGLVSRMNSRL